MLFSSAPFPPPEDLGGIPEGPPVEGEEAGGGVEGGGEGAGEGASNVPASGPEAGEAGGKGGEENGVEKGSRGMILLIFIMTCNVILFIVILFIYCNLF